MLMVGYGIELKKESADMVKVSGTVSECAPWKSGDKSGMNFSVDGLRLIPDDSLDVAELPAVGTEVTAVVRPIYSAKKKRQYLFVVGFSGGGNGSG